MKKTLALITLLFVFPTVSHSKVVVVPMIESLKVKNVITVAKGGGDFTDIANALDSITDPSPDNPYLVQIGPGQFVTTRTIKVENDVTLVGSGTNATTIKGNLGGLENRFESVIDVDFNTALANFSVEAIGNGDGAAAAITAIRSSDIGPPSGLLDGVTINNVDIRVSNANNNFGILINDTINLYAENLSIFATGNGVASSQIHGINNNSGAPASDMRVHNTDITAYCPGATNATNCIGIGVYNRGFLWLINSRIVSALIPNNTNSTSFARDLFDINSKPGVVIDIERGSEVRMNSSFVNGEIMTYKLEGCNGFRCSSVIRAYNSWLSNGIQGDGISLCSNTSSGDRPLDSTCQPIFSNN